VGFEGKWKKMLHFINLRKSYHWPGLSFYLNRFLASLVTWLCSLTEPISNLRMEVAFASEILVSAYGAKRVSKPRWTQFGIIPFVVHYSLHFGMLEFDSLLLQSGIPLKLSFLYHVTLRFNCTYSLNVRASYLSPKFISASFSSCLLSSPTYINHAYFFR
jgi:hypothetical protein